MFKSANFFTASRLLKNAAEILHNSTVMRNGAHVSITNAIIDASTPHYPISAVSRALRVIDMLFRDEVTGRMMMFGARVSSSGNPYAVNNVLVNRDHRVTALLMASAVAVDRITHTVKRANTAPGSPLTDAAKKRIEKDARKTAREAAPRQATKVLPGSWQVTA